MDVKDILSRCRTEAVKIFRIRIRIENFLNIIVNFSLNYVKNVIVFRKFNIFSAKNYHYDTFLLANSKCNLVKIVSAGLSVRWIIFNWSWNPIGSGRPSRNHRRAIE